MTAPAPAIKPINAPLKTPKPVKPIDANKIAYKQPELAVAAKPEQQKVLDDVIDKISNGNLNARQKQQVIQDAVLAIEEFKYQNDRAQMDAMRAKQDTLLRYLEKVKGGQSIDDALAEYRRKYEQLNGTRERQLAQLETRKAEVDAAWTLLGRLDPANSPANLAIQNLARKNNNYAEMRMNIELNDRFESDLRNAIARIEQGQVLNEAEGTLAKATPAEVKAMIAVDIENAIEKRGKKLDAYLKDKWKSSNVRPKFEDMTPEKWRTLTQAQKKQYLTEAYSHKMIKGKNGKFYNAVVQSVDGVNRFEVVISFSEVDKDGNVIRAGVATARRSEIDPTNGNVYQASFFINKDSDKGSDIATIFNQHAFLYLKNIGIKKAGVGPADDGRYVWGRVGFKTERGIHTQEHFNSIKSALDFYKSFGSGGLIATDEQYFKVKKLLEMAKSGVKVNHQDFHFAIDKGDVLLDKARRDYVKHWFSSKLPVTAAYLNFGEQKIGGFVSPRKKKLSKKT